MKHGQAVPDRAMVGLVLPDHQIEASSPLGWPEFGK
jgi:hypothetical protein